MENSLANGIPVEVTSKETGHSLYVSIHSLVNDSISTEKCIKYFNELKESGIIMDSSFEDNVWVSYYFLKDAKTHIDFSGLFPEKILLSLKKFVIVKIAMQKNATISIQRAVQHIKNMLAYTHLLNPGYINDFKNYVLESRERMKCFSYLLEFLAFTSLENAEEYYKNLCSLHIQQENNTRDIPCYESIIIFDMIIKNFIDTACMEIRIRYYPILLWWVISTIIPLRTSEFLLLKRNCIYKSKGKCYIHIDRIKNNHKAHMVLLMTEFQIPENIYLFIHDFIDYANELDDSKYLISHNFYLSTFNSALYKGVPRMKINLDIFNRIFNYFSKEVIEDIYKFKVVELGQKTKDCEIERIKPGDTRHLAFMNMMMQGLNPLYIQRIGGHYTLNEQIHYCKHLDTFMSSKTYLLSKFLKDKNINMNSSINEDMNPINWSAKQTEKELLGLQFYNLPKVKNGAGRCTSKNVPSDCVAEECLFCDKFIPEKNVSQEYIEEMRKSNQQNIEIKKQLLQTLLKEQIKDEQQISIESKNLATLTNQKMIIDAYQLNMKEDDTNEQQ